MANRRSIPARKSKRSFTKNADRTHKLNVKPRPMRGGIRL